jgi:hypothetical protein
LPRRSPFAAPNPEAQTPRLFLGDNGHHRPADRFKQLQPVMAKQGIEMDYTEKMDDVNPAKLAGYDCLAILRTPRAFSPNRKRRCWISSSAAAVRPDSLRELLLLNSPKYIELVGGQFKSHGTGRVQGNDRELQPSR